MLTTHWTQTARPLAPCRGEGSLSRMTKPLVIVITGSTRGIGKGMAVEFAKRGHHVVLSGRSQEAAETAARELQPSASGESRLIGVSCDVARRGDIEALWQRSVDAFGKVDIWINNAGGTDDAHVQPMTVTTDDQMRDMLELNLIAAAAGSREAALRMPNGGAIVNISSGAGMRAAPNTAAYAASKAALLNLTQTMAAELASEGIRVNAISPGMVPTESFYRVLQFTDADMPKLAATVPLGRMGTPEDMAAGVLYLASPAAGWVTGQNILIGGGRDGGKSVEHR